MSLEIKLTALAQAIGFDMKNNTTNIGNLAALTTTNKTSLVNAINEVKSTTTSIDDNAASNSTTKTYSANKVTTLITTAKADVKAEILGGADPAFDTLKELQDGLVSDQTAVSGLITAVGNRIRFDASQTLTTPQQATACANIGVGNPEVDLVSIYNTAKS